MIKIKLLYKNTLTILLLGYKISIVFISYYEGNNE